MTRLRRRAYSSALLLLPLLIFLIYVARTSSFPIFTASSASSLRSFLLPSPSIPQDVFTSVPWINQSAADPYEATWRALRDLDRKATGSDKRRRRVSWGALRAQGPKKSLKDNLRADKRYFYTDYFAGFTNQFFTVCNVIFLAQDSARIPILAPFSVDQYHTGSWAPTLPVSAVFDLSLLRPLFNDLPIVETFELKVQEDMSNWYNYIEHDSEFSQLDDAGVPLRLGAVIRPEEPEWDEIGCWSWKYSNHEEARMLEGWWIDGNNMMPLPLSVFHQNNTYKGSFSRLSDFFRHDRWPGPDSHELLEPYGFPFPSLMPDNHVACIDLMYYFYEHVTIHSDILDELRRGEGVWNRVGRYMRFQPGLVGLANEFVRMLFALRPNVQIPHFMVVHVRRADFPQEWIDKPQREWMYTAERILQVARDSLGVDIRHVLLATDEEDPEWIQPFLNIGWRSLDHTSARTIEKIGPWMPTLLDAIIMASSTAFVGCQGSTMSMIALNRVRDWNQGVGTLEPSVREVPKDWEWTWDSPIP